MTSRNRQEGIYTYAEDSTGALSTDYEASKQRHATVYDAVAGRVALKFSKDSVPSGSSSRKTSSGHHQLADPVLAPEEVLFSRKNAPQRYAENDIYFAHEALPDGGQDVLPDSDLLKAVHGYAGHFYEAMSRSQNNDKNERVRIDERSMDGTALLAFGILLEEAARDTLGRDGDLVFTEGVDDDDDDDDDDLGSDRRSTPGTGGSQTPVGFEGEESFWRRKYSKRRKIKDER